MLMYELASIALKLKVYFQLSNELNRSNDEPKFIGALSLFTAEKPNQNTLVGFKAVASIVNLIDIALCLVAIVLIADPYYFDDGTFVKFCRGTALAFIILAAIFCHFLRTKKTLSIQLLICGTELVMSPFILWKMWSGEGELVIFWILGGKV